MVTDVGAGRFNRVVCYCDDCQAFARWLGREDLLDAHGGSDIVQLWPSRVRFSEGVDRLRLLRLGPKGLFRWYTSCCKSPAGNTLPSTGSPFVGFPAACLGAGERSLDDLLGPPVGAIQGRFARGSCPPGVHPTVSLGVIARSVSFLLRGVVKGSRAPSPYVRGGKLLVDAQVLTAEERRAL